MDAALLDVNLDGASTTPVAVELNARTVPFVVVTGYGDLSLDSAVLNEAPRVTKPLIISRLAGVLEETLAR